jgi:hypothetical protein
MVVVEHAARRAVGRTDADQPGGKLVEVGFSYYKRAGRAQPAHHLGVRGGVVGKRRASGGGGQPGRVEIILHRERHAVKRQLLPVRASPLERGGLREHILLVTQADPDMIVAPGGDAGVDLADDLHGRGAGRVGRGQRGKIQTQGDEHGRKAGGARGPGQKRGAFAGIGGARRLEAESGQGRSRYVAGCDTRVK